MFPSFSSFKQSAQEQGEEDENDRRKRSRQDRDDKPRKRHERGSDRRRHRHREGLRDSERRSRRTDHEHDKPAFTTDVINERIGHASHLFFLDETGDDALLKFSQPYRKELPTYRRASNLVVGDHLRIIPSKEDFEKFLVTLCRVNPSEVPSSSHDSGTDSAYYLKYHQCPKKSVPYYMVAEEGSSTVTTDSFISIEETPSTTDDILKGLLQQRMQIQRDLNMHPTVSQWEQMAAIQEAIAILGSSKLKLSEDQKLQLNISVFTVALKGLPEKPDIVLRYMDAFEGLLSNIDSDVNTKWKSFTAYDQNPPKSLVADVRIWERRVDALLLDRHSNFTTIYLGLEKIFADIKEWKTKDESVDMDTIYHASLRRLFVIWDDLGYTTWTVNLIQALLEHAFFFKYDESLEDFWSTRQPRLGDSRSKGWKYSPKDPVSLPEGTDDRTPFDEVLFEDISPFIQTSQDNLQLLWACLLHMGLIIPGKTLPRSLMFEISEDQIVNNPQVTSQAIHLCELIFREVEDDPDYKAFTTWWGDSDYTADSSNELFEVGTRIRSMASRGLAFDPRIFSKLEQFLDTEPGWQLFLTYGQLTGLDCSYILREAVSRIPMPFSWWKAYIESVGNAEKQELMHLALHKLPWSRDLHVWLNQCDWVSPDHKEAIRTAMMRRQMNISLGVLDDDTS